MKKYIIPTLIVFCLTFGYVIGNAINKTPVEEDTETYYSPLLFPKENKIDKMLQLLRYAYVDDLNMDSLTEETLKDIVSKLDPHSAYIPADEIEEVNSELTGSFSGIGIQFSIQNDTVNIVSVITGGPSDGVGVLAGDKILYVDDSLFCGKKITNEKVMKVLRGPKDTKVTIKVKRGGTKDLLSYTIVRGDIPVTSIDARFIIEVQGTKIGFVRVNKFGATTYDEFITALNLLKSKGASSYIVDLRENSGGYMVQAIRMANEFLESGDLIVYAQGKSYRREESKANGNGRFRKPQLVVLIDDFSASASEIFAGAMQDNDRGTIIGRRSFGKGLVQQQIDFADSSAVRLTVARYYIPSGRCIQKPYHLGEDENYQLDLLTRFEHGEFYSADSIHYLDTTKYYTKQGRVVYGGGGVMPDIFVGRDTSANSPFYNQVVNLALTYQFALQYTDTHRKELKAYKDWRTLEKHLIASNWWDEFMTFAKSKEIEIKDTSEVARSKEAVMRLINAYIVRNILDDDNFFALIERDDEITKRAVEFLTTKK